MAAAVLFVRRFFGGAVSSYGESWGKGSPAWKDPDDRVGNRRGRGASRRREGPAADDVEGGVVAAATALAAKAVPTIEGRLRRLGLWRFGSRRVWVNGRGVCAVFRMQKWKSRKPVDDRAKSSSMTPPKKNSSRPYRAVLALLNQWGALRLAHALEPRWKTLRSSIHHSSTHIPIQVSLDPEEKNGGCKCD